LNGWINYPSNNNLRHEQVDDIVILGLKI